MILECLSIPEPLTKRRFTPRSEQQSEQSDAILTQLTAIHVDFVPTRSLKSPSQSPFTERSSNQTYHISKDAKIRQINPSSRESGGNNDALGMKFTSKTRVPTKAQPKNLRNLIQLFSEVMRFPRSIPLEPGATSQIRLSIHRLKPIHR